MLKSVFFFAGFLTGWTYVLYPIGLYVIAKLKGLAEDRTPSAEGFTPSVGVICAMYNEEKVVAAKLANLSQISYPHLHFYIGSDGSTDRTNQLLKEDYSDDRVTICEYPRRGKVHVVNDLVRLANEDILVFTDANTIFEPDAVANLIKPMCDPRIGVVCGRLVLVRDGHPSGEGIYWKYETAIKRLESHFNCVVGANGAIYAIRRSLVHPLPADTINDDFTNSMRVYLQGFGMKYAPDAVAYEEANHDDSVEFKRHVRDAAGHFRALVHLAPLLNPFKSRVFLPYVSHRVIRWFVPLFLVLMLLCPLFLTMDRTVSVLFAAETLFYGLAGIGWATKSRLKFLYVPYYFLCINAALVLGFWRNVFGIQKVTWNSTQR